MLKVLVTLRMDGIVGSSRSMGLRLARYYLPVDFRMRRIL